MGVELSQDAIRLFNLVCPPGKTGHELSFQERLYGLLVEVQIARETLGHDLLPAVTLNDEGVVDDEPIAEPGRFFLNYGESEITSRVFDDRYQIPSREEINYLTAYYRNPEVWFRRLCDEAQKSCRNTFGSSLTQTEQVLNLLDHRLK